MTLALMQAYFFPYIGYFQLIDAADKMIIYDHVSFRKRTWITRNRLLDKGSSTPFWINVPVLGASFKKTIGHTLIDDSTDWRKVIRDLLYYNYKKAPYFGPLFDQILPILETRLESIHSYNAHTIQSLCQLMEIDTELVSKNENYIALEKQLPTLASESKTEVRSERILKICENESAEHYINAIGGESLYSKDVFAKRDIKLSFVQSLPYTYKQFGGPFEAHLSILDVLFLNGLDNTKRMIKNYQLI